jgi:hydrophobic/amphiphilic exporter-1 (mainly G- bacteria), HAE1 family
MQRLAEICVQRPVFATMLGLALLIVGSVSYTRLGVDRQPSVDLPTVRVRTTLPGAAPEEVEIELSDRVEEAVNTVAGIEQLRSISGPGSSVVIATFALDRDIDVAAQDIRDRVQSIQRDLPLGTEPPVVAKVDSEGEPVLSIALSGARTIRELTEIADKIVLPRIERSRGVGEIQVSGDVARTINIWVRSDRLAAHGLPISAVRDAVAAQNADVPAGNVTGSQREWALRSVGRLRTPEEFEALVLRRVDGVAIRLGDVARVEDGTREPRRIARLNGSPTVVLEVLRQSDANTIEVVESVKEKAACWPVWWC